MYEKDYSDFIDRVLIDLEENVGNVTYIKGEANIKE